MAREVLRWCAPGIRTGPPAVERVHLTAKPRGRPRIFSLKGMLQIKGIIHKNIYITVLKYSLMYILFLLEKSICYFLFIYKSKLGDVRILLVKSISFVTTTDLNCLPPAASEKSPLVLWESKKPSLKGRKWWSNPYRSLEISAWITFSTKIYILCKMSHGNENLLNLMSCMERWWHLLQFVSKNKYIVLWLL